MRHLVIGTLFILLFMGCNQQSASGPFPTATPFQSEKMDGRWTTDLETAQELKGLRNTIDNFTLLNKKKFENLKAYQEFGDLLQMHIDRTTTHCQLNAEVKSELCVQLDKLKAEIQILQGNDMEKSKQAVGNINHILTEIDSSFIYMN